MPPTETDNISLLRSLFEELTEKAKANQESLDLAREAVALANSLPAKDENRTEFCAISEAFLAEAFRHRGQLGLAIEHGLMAVDALEASDNLEVLARLYSCIGYCYAQLGDSYSAFPFFLKLKTLGTTNGEHRFVSDSHNGFAFVYFILGDLDQSLGHELAALHINEKHGSMLQQAKSFNNLCHSYLEQDNFVEALKYGLAGIDRLSQPEGEKYGSLNGLLHINVYQAYAYQGELDSAETFLNKAALLLNGSSHSYFKAVLCHCQGEAAFFREEYDKAIQLVKESLTPIDGQLNTLFEQKSNLLLYKIYSQIGDFEKALHHHKALYECEVKRYKDDTKSKLSALMSTFQFERERREAELLYYKTIELEKRVEEQTLKISSSLEREKDLAKSLETALEQAEELNVVKSKVIEVVSHEFRTPLTIINNSAGLLENYYDRMDEEKRRRHFDNIQAASERMTFLVRDVEIVGDLNSTAFQPNMQLTKGQEIFELIKTRISSDTERSERVRLTQDDICKDLNILTDIEFIRRIVCNLISNALKFSEGVVDVAFGINHSSLTITIQDDGIGVPQQEQDKIFNLLERGSNVRSIGGLGLGLYISTQLADQIEATIKLKSAGEGEGATMRLSVPISVPVSVENRPKRTPTPTPIYN